MVFFLILSVLLLLLPDLYIWLSFVHGAVPVYWSAAWWFPSGLALAVSGAAAAGSFRNWQVRIFFFVSLCVAVPKLLFTLFSLVGRGVGLFVPGTFAACNALGIVAAVGGCVVFLYGTVYGWKRLVVREITVGDIDLPEAFDGYRIVLFSDLHVGTYGRNDRFVRTLVDRIDALKPDLIVFAGDIVNVSADELDVHMQVLSELLAADGVYSIVGNHDYCEYGRYDSPDGATFAFEEVKRKERAMGWNLLLNESRTIRRGGDSIVLLGVENDSRPPFPSKGDLRRAMEGVPDGAFKILLSHDPTHWRREVLPETNIRLTLSGHTHAMQFRLGGFSPCVWAYPEWNGPYREGERMLYVSPGVGGTVPFRFGAWPEIEVVTLRREKRRVATEFLPLHSF